MTGPHFPNNLFFMTENEGDTITDYQLSLIDNTVYFAHRELPVILKPTKNIALMAISSCYAKTDNVTTASRKNLDRMKHQSLGKYYCSESYVIQRAKTFFKDHPDYTLIVPISLYDHVVAMFIRKSAARKFDIRIFDANWDNWDARTYL